MVRGGIRKKTNRHASRQALNLAVAAEKDGNADEAERFAQKSQALFPSPEAEALLQRLRAESIAAAARQRSATRDAESVAAAVHKARQRSATRDATPAPSQARGSSAVAVAEVKRVMCAQHHYEVFGVAMDADTVTIRKTYRKLALLVHPDKNSVQPLYDSNLRTYLYHTPIGSPAQAAVLELPDLFTCSLTYVM